jgi:hypothetical protein
MKKYLTILSFVCSSVFGQLGYYASTIVPLDKDAAKYLKAISTLHTPTTTQYTAANYLAINLKKLNWTTSGTAVFGDIAGSRIKALYPMFGTDSVFDQTNFMNPTRADSSLFLTGSGVTLIHNASYGVYFGSNYYQTHWTMSATYQNDFFVYCYLPQETVPINGCVYGTTDRAVELFPIYSGTIFYYKVCGSGFGSKANTQQLGQWIINRKASTYSTIDHNTTVLDSTVVASSPTTNVLDCGRESATYTWVSGELMGFAYGKSFVNYSMRQSFMNIMYGVNGILGRNKY